MTDPQAPSSADSPWPVRLVSTKIAGWIDRLGAVWVEGQVVQFNRRPGSGMAFLVLRDTDADFSLPVSVYASVLERTPAELAEGARVIVHAKPTFWPKRGSLQLQASEIRPVGLGELLARIEHLKRVLAAEGLFDAERKLHLPFAPGVVGLICGRESKAEHDVVVNARARWPGLEFLIREVAVQGNRAVSEVTAALSELDADPSVEVIVIARGGGAVEDLLPFSNETLVRAAAACRTPLVSAIGHETDTPLLDLVADYRASTPTAAAKRIVPDLTEERALITQARGRLDAGITGLIHSEQQRLDALRSRPALADYTWIVQSRRTEITALRDAARQHTALALECGQGQIQQLSAQVRALSPQATLDRGYAVVQLADDAVLRDPGQVHAGDRLRIRIAHGEVAAKVDAEHPASPATDLPTNPDLATDPDQQP